MDASDGDESDEDEMEDEDEDDELGHVVEESDGEEDEDGSCNFRFFVLFSVE